MSAQRMFMGTTLAAGLLLAGCGKIPPTHYYVLSTSGASLPEMSADLPAFQVGVQTFQVEPPYDQDRIVYRIGSSSPEVSFYAYHRWAAPLSRMLPGEVARVLDSGNSRTHFEPWIPERAYDGILEGHLLLLEEVDTPDGEHARLKLRLILRTPDGAEIWTAIVARDVTGQADTVGDIVLQMRSALEDAVRGAQPAIGEALRRAPPNLGVASRGDPDR